MRTSVNIIKLIGLTFLFFSNHGFADSSLKFVSYNIYNEETPYGTPHHLCKHGNCTTELWPHRKDKVVNLIKSQDADIIALQEDIQHQVEYIENALGPGYSRAGLNAAADGVPGLPNGVATWPSKALHTIFYKYSKFIRLNSGHFWLSETPEIALTTYEHGRRAAVVSWGKFQDKANAKGFYVFNTHLHAFRECKYKIVRAKEVTLLAQKIHEINKEDLPVVVLGDLNLTWFDEEDRLILRYLTEPGKQTPTQLNCDDSVNRSYDLNHPKQFDPFKPSFDIQNCNQSSCTVLPMAINNTSFYRKYDYILLSPKINLIDQNVSGNSPYYSDGNYYYISDHTMISSTVNLNSYPSHLPRTMLIEYEDDFVIPILN